MGNSVGNLQDYWDAIESARSLAGRLHLGLGRPGIRKPMSHGPKYHRPTTPTLSAMVLGRWTTSERCPSDAVVVDDDPRLELTGRLTLEAVILGNRAGSYCPLISKGDHQYLLRLDGGGVNFTLHRASGQV